VLIFCQMTWLMAILAEFLTWEGHHFEGRYKATWKGEFKLPWREAGPTNHLDDKVDSDQ